MPGRHSLAPQNLIGLPVLTAVILAALAVSLLILTGPTRLDLTELAAPFGTIVGFLLCAQILTVSARNQARPWLPRLILLARGLAFLQLAWVVIRLFNHTTMAIPFPFADDLLAGWDAALGLDWMAWFTFVAERPWLNMLLDWSYGSLTPLSMLAFLVIVLCLEPLRARYYLETMTITALLCTLCGMFFPAIAAVDYHFGAGVSFPGFATEPGRYHLESLTALRSGQEVFLHLGSLPGLTTFPSFHHAGCHLPQLPLPAGAGLLRDDDRLDTGFRRALFRRSDRRNGTGAGRAAGCRASARLSRALRAIRR